MKDVLNYTIRRGLIFSVVVLFLILIGFTTTASEIFGDLFQTDSSTMIGNTGGLFIFWGLVGLWGGYQASSSENSNFLKTLAAGMFSGVLMGGIISLFIYLVSSLDAADVEMRDYFVQLTRPSVNLLLYGKDIVPGVLQTLLIFVVSATAGGLLQYGILLMRNLGDGSWILMEKISELREKPAVDKVITSQWGKWTGYILLLGLVILIPQGLSKYWNYAMGTVGIYVLMGLGLNIVVGLAGLLDLGYVAFFAIGAYTTGLLTAPAPIPLQIGFWPALLVSVILAAMAGILLGLPVLRMRGDYLAIVTLGFGEIIRVLIRSDMLSPFLGGPQGVRDISGPSLFGYSLNSEKAYLYMIIVGILFTILLTNHLQSSRVGRAWRAMREDETVAQAMGINTLYYKLMAFATGAAFAGIGGALFAARNQYTGPADHSLMVSINVLCLLIVGGMGSVPGVIVGAFVLKGLPEILRELELFRLLVFGALLVIMMIWRPEGLWPAPRRRLELHEADIGEIPKDNPPGTAQKEGQAI